jgi:hypothetical protein
MSFEYKGKKFDYTDSEMGDVFTSVYNVAANLSRAWEWFSPDKKKDIRSKAGRLAEAKIVALTLIRLAPSTIKEQTTGKPIKKDAQVLAQIFEPTEARSAWLDKGGFSVQEQGEWVPLRQKLTGLDILSGDHKKITAEQGQRISSHVAILRDLGFDRIGSVLEASLGDHEIEPPEIQSRNLPCRWKPRL